MIVRNICAVFIPIISGVSFLCAMEQFGQVTDLFTASDAGVISQLDELQNKIEAMRSEIRGQRRAWMNSYNKAFGARVPEEGIQVAVGEKVKQLFEAGKKYTADTRDLDALTTELASHKAFVAHVLEVDPAGLLLTDARRALDRRWQANIGTHIDGTLKNATGKLKADQVLRKTIDNAFKGADSAYGRVLALYHVLAGQLAGALALNNIKTPKARGDLQKTLSDFVAGLLERVRPVTS